MESDVKRISKQERDTKETKIKVSLDLDGSGKSNIDSGIGFFDHMLEGFAKHGFFDLNLQCDGDIHVDGHHTVEDCGIVLGQAIKVIYVNNSVPSHVYGDSTFKNRTTLKNYNSGNYSGDYFKISGCLDLLT